MKNLDDSQLESFDTEYVNMSRWKIIQSHINRDFPQGNFNFIDIGGGNGIFADRLLEEYKNSSGTVLDNSQLLLNRNLQHERKTIINESVYNLKSLNLQTYDIVFFNWVLHHLVLESYKQTRHNIISTIANSRNLLSPGGKISIFENMYNGLIFNGLPSSIIYHLTSSKLLANVVKKGGANTAGVGVCFLSEKQWRESLFKAEVREFIYTDDDKWIIPLSWNILLHVGHIRCGHFWVCT